MDFIWLASPYMQFIRLLLPTLLIAILVNSCMPNPQKQYVFRVGHVANEDHTWHQALNYFGKILKERSQDRIKVEVYPAEQLGKEIEVLRSIQAGIVEMTITGASLQNWTEIAAFCEMPFLIRDSSHLKRFVNGPLGKRIKDAILTDTGLRAVAYFQRGPRHLTSNRPIRHPDDLKGMILRVPNVPAYVTAWSALGAKPTPMAFTEVFTSLQQGTVEGQENPFAMIRSANFAEVQKYLNLTGHIISWGYIVVGENQFQALPDDLQDMFLRAARDMQTYERRIFLSKEKENQEALKAKGMEFIEVDKAAFIDKSAEAIFNSLSPEMQEFYEEIRELGS